MSSINDFLSCYGYDWKDISDRQEIENFRLGAIALISEELLLETENIPKEIRNQADIRLLMLELSVNTDEKKKQWICALLRVMHTLAHSHSYLNSRYSSEIREQILNSFTPYVKQTNGKVSIGHIALKAFECRPEKTHRSVAMKLLHKPENVAADIFDWIGLRFVTCNKIDVLRVLSFLREKNIVMFANIKPSRTRNTLLDLKRIEAASKSGLDFEKIKDLIEQQPIPNDNLTHQENAFSESSYHSVQFTCRQRIKVKTFDGNRINFFFPYEIQLIDQKSYQRARSGMASHKEYKRRQRLSIRKRILPHLVATSNT
jgi:uncharacterized protein (TIGR04562 family)